jgi:hypothetical protein
MKMWTKKAAALLLAGGLATPALAASAATDADQAGGPKMTSMRQQLTDDLTKSGFTDVKVMPESLLVRAKDSKGNPVMMVINPDSLTIATEVTAPKSSSQKMDGNANGEKVLSGKNANGDPTPPAKQ